MQESEVKLKTDLRGRCFAFSLSIASESVYWLNLLREAKLASESDVNNLLQELDEISRMIASSIINLKKSL